MLDDQHGCQASVGSSVFRGKLARMRVSLSASAGIFSALGPLLTEETVFFFSSRSTDIRSARTWAEWLVRTMSFFSLVIRGTSLLVRRCLNLLII